MLRKAEQPAPDSLAFQDWPTLVQAAPVQQASEASCPPAIPATGPVPRISYAQNMEDILLDRLFKGQTGSFIDVGAHHPFLDNNTYFFYERGWRGVNVEPLPHLHRLLVEHRPRDLNLAVAVSDIEGAPPFYEITQCQGLSTLSAEVADRHRRQGLQVVAGCLRVRSLQSLIREYGIEAPDLLSIDVEGHEQQVIRGTPLATWRPKVIVVESTLPLSTIPSHQAWEPILLTHDYLFAAFNGVNRFYLRQDLRDKLGLFQVPVSVLDNYTKWETVLLQNRIRQLESRIQELERLESRGLFLPASAGSGVCQRL